jgi:hydrogenase maturation protein HypF
MVVKDKHVVCSGGCFQNRIIRNALFEGATEKGLIVYYPKQVPLNDAGISLGQVLIASLNQNLFIN